MVAGARLHEKAPVKRVAIVGAGVGGLTLANALCTDGMEVDEVKVFEKFDSVKPGIGGGVQINSGAIVLARLGLGDAIKVRTHFILLHRFARCLAAATLLLFSERANSVHDVSLIRQAIMRSFSLQIGFFR